MPDNNSRTAMRRRLKKSEARLQKIGSPESPQNEEPDKGNAGRPTDYDPKYCKELIEHMSKGYSFETFIVKCRVSRGTLYNWLKEHREFLDAKDEGEALSQEFLEKLGLNGAAGRLPGFNAVAWKHFMNNRCGWKNQVDVTSKGKAMNPVSVNITLPSNGRELKK